MYYVASTQLQESKKTIISDLNITPVRSMNSLFKNQQSPVFLHYLTKGYYKNTKSLG